MLLSLATVATLRISLWLIPFHLVHRSVERLAQRFAWRKSNDAIPIERVSWAIAATAARIPRASCLTQALAGRMLFSAYGYATTLRIGVAKDDVGGLRAHAWIESAGRAILGDPRTESFVPLAPAALPR